jgi:hypothetical protein
VNRKQFIQSSIILGSGLPFLGCGQSKPQSSNNISNWNSGEVSHILPTVNHHEMLISTSYLRPVLNPVLKIGNRTVNGQKRDSKGLFWAFHAQELQDNTSYDLQIFENDLSLCDSWLLKTFPQPNSDPEQLRLMIFTCAGGHPLAQNLLPVPEDQREPSDLFTQKRIKLLARGLSMNPDAIIAIGDSIYWDLNGNGKTRLGTSTDERAIAIAGKFDEKQPILGTENEEVLKRAVSPQIIGLYGTACRSTPVFFFKDDHDYFENDEANDQFVSFPPKAFNLDLGRTVQQMYLPEFLSDENRPLDLPDANAPDRVKGSSESFGTLRFGRLAELLMYDCRRFVTLDHDKAEFIPKVAEKWLIDRTQSQEVKHTIHIPSTPFGWSAGKWLEWYPDLLGEDKKLHADLNKYLWQKGWQNQHDRLLNAMYNVKHKKPITISGDLHTLASGRIHRNGTNDYSDNPINSVIAGTVGSIVFPSTFRKIKAAQPEAIGMEEDFENIEENGFSIVDFDSKNVHVKMYKYLWSKAELDSIDDLNAFTNVLI